jgi:hypothetical protein
VILIGLFSRAGSRDHRNVPPASASARNNNTVGLVFLEPGSLGSATSPTWVYRNFTPAQGPAAAVTFLNEPLRQGARGRQRDRSQRQLRGTLLSRAGPSENSRLRGGRFML